MSVNNQLSSPQCWGLWCSVFSSDQDLFVDVCLCHCTTCCNQVHKLDEAWSKNATTRVNKIPLTCGQKCFLSDITVTRQLCKTYASRSFVVLSYLVNYLQILV